MMVPLIRELSHLCCSPFDQLCYALAIDVQSRCCRFIQISREHGINIVVKDFYQESKDFAMGKLPETITTAQQDLSEMSTPVKQDRYVELDRPTYETKSLHLLLLLLIGMRGF